MKTWVLVLPAVVLLLTGQAAMAGIKVTVGHNDSDHARPGFTFANVPTPKTNTAATTARLVVVAGEPDPNGGGVGTLNDGKLPGEEDDPAANFFFKAGTDGGRLRLDFPKIINLRQVNTYSWHPDTRGPQVYKLYASDGTTPGYNPAPKEGIDPESCGWKLIAQVNTGSDQAGQNGGQYGVSIASSDGSIGKFSHLLFDIGASEDEDDFGNTFYSEINVIDADAPASLQ